MLIMLASFLLSFRQPVVELVKGRDIRHISLLLIMNNCLITIVRRNQAYTQLPITRKNQIISSFQNPPLNFKFSRMKILKKWLNILKVMKKAH